METTIIYRAYIGGYIGVILGHLITQCSNEFGMSAWVTLMPQP